MKKKFPILSLVAGLAVLLLFQYKGVMPLAYKAAQSDLFLVDTQDEGSNESASNAMTTQAFNQCNDYIKDELGEQVAVTFSAAPINSWGLGNYEYLINADITLNAANEAPVTQKYACRIQYTNSEDMSQVNNKEHWSVIGISGIDRL